MNIFRNKYRINSPLTFVSLTFLLNCAGGFLTTNSAQAFTLDFSNPAVIETDGTRTINTNENLNPSLLDGAGQSIDLDLTDSNPATTFSTTSGNVGELFSPIGIDLSFTGGGGAGPGLFDSNCGNGIGPACTGGDPDLGTGGNFGTTPQGNLIINEENVGDSDPDDEGGGGLLTLDFDQVSPSNPGGILNNVLIDSISIVDNTIAAITINFVDGGTEVVDIDFELNANPHIVPNGASNAMLSLTPSNGGDNAVGVVSGFAQDNVDSISINFSTSGGIGDFTFAEFTGTDVAVPFEFSSGLGLLLSGVGFLGLKVARRKKLAKKQQCNLLS